MFYKGTSCQVEAHFFNWTYSIMYSRRYTCTHFPIGTNLCAIANNTRGIKTKDPCFSFNRLCEEINGSLPNYTHKVNGKVIIIIIISILFWRGSALLEQEDKMFYNMYFVMKIDVFFSITNM